MTSRVDSWSLNEFPLCALTLAAFLAVPCEALAQIGWTSDHVLGEKGATRTYVPPGHPADDAVQVKPVQGETVGAVYHLQKNRVRGLSLKLEHEVTVDDALKLLEKVSGLPKVPKEFQKKPTWELDGHQLSVYPPLGAWQNRNVIVPVAKVPVGAINKWTNYYDHWGKYLGSSPVRTEPLLTTYSKYAGTFQFQATKFVVPLVRVDDAAYAWVEFSGDSVRRAYVTNAIYLAEPEFYFRMRFAAMRRQGALLDDAEVQKARFRASLADLRPYHLEVRDQYEQALLDHVPTTVGADILALWRVNALVGSVDNVHVPMPTVSDLLSQVPVDLVRVELLRDMKKQKIVDVRIRRAVALDALGSLDWVPPMAGLLKQKEQRDKALTAMRQLAARRVKSAQELDDLGYDDNKWEHWYLDKK